MIKKASNASPFVYGDMVYYIHPPLDRKSIVVGLEDFDASIQQFMVLGQYHDWVAVTSEKLIERTFEERFDYWNEKNEEGYFVNFSSYELGKACVRVIWRDYLFSTLAGVIAFQLECISKAKTGLDNYANRLSKESG